MFKINPLKRVSQLPLSPKEYFPGSALTILLLINLMLLFFKTVRLVLLMIFF